MLHKLEGRGRSELPGRRQPGADGSREAEVLRQLLGTAPAPTAPAANRWDRGKGQRVGNRKWRRATREEENGEGMKPLL